MPVINEGERNEKWAFDCGGHDVAPFDKCGGAIFEGFEETNRFEVVASSETIGIHVHQLANSCIGPTVIGVGDGEGRAGDLVSDPEVGGDHFCEGGFARTELPDQQDGVSRSESLRQRSAHHLHGVQAGSFHAELGHRRHPFEDGTATRLLGAGRVGLESERNRNAG